MTRFFCLSIAAIACLSALTGCSDRLPWLSAGDAGQSLVLRAEVHARDGDRDGALDLYQQAMEQNPRLARPQFEAAVLYHDYRQDYLRALYHYQRYLEMRPDTEKRALIEDRMRLARQGFAAGLQRRSGPATAPAGDARENAARIITLEQENARLRQQIDALQESLESTTRELREARAVRERRAPEAVAAPKTYRVKRGDTLSAIAAREYGDAGRWQEIADANREKLRGSTKVQEGQVITIP